MTNMVFWMWRIYYSGQGGKPVPYLIARAFTAKEARAIFKYHGYTGGRMKKFRPEPPDVG